MTYSTDFRLSIVSNPYLSSNLADPVTATTAQFKQLTVDDQLAVLWYAYTEMGRSITPAAPGAARLQFAEGILAQIKKMAYDDQLQVMRDLASNANTPISRSYGVLSVNTKLAFWYQLGEMMVQGTVAPMPAGYQLSEAGRSVLEMIKQLDMGQQITVLRNTVVNMGVDPLAD
ncbi:orange carotenoid protein N-terminal domain-containing protein [Leptolyngbya sp. FACHB-711]|uniref:orange carotenoid protein N-terminal domain-containing protein n=1 Tax=unclassified Leptolyngbya TaxID=2650499 RepID=UPI00168973A9|nr:orange carotenoid protein N-terminal domain-containing protein [Leptolyngbya sp. FACHB-711]MBD1850368.1 orange carotenoid protein [Cyanobacteria bacterium FACHB-502]MBD2024082.1 orange carotenoid protein [Leptolyngbya sp. FACHB-711]